MIGRFTLDQLHVLVAIADVGSFSAAGRKLRRAQSAISQAVATLEAAQGVTLFDRGGHRPRLTGVGRVLVGQARAGLADANRFEAMAAATREGTVPEDIAALPLVSIDLVPVVAPGHPLARLGRPAVHADLDKHVQLVLSDPSAPDGPGYGVLSTKAWRLVELPRRLDALVAGLAGVACPSIWWRRSLRGAFRPAADQR